MSLENNILEAIDILVSKAVQEAEQDKTIQAIIQECLDENLGEYRCKYQDSVFIAQGGGDKKYTNNSLVYILIPKNDMSARKTILGTVDNLGIDYAKTQDTQNYYDIVGVNCIAIHNEIPFSSYHDGTIDLWDIDSENNIIDVNLNDVNAYIKHHSNIMIQAAFRTALAQNQQFHGNYGIIFTLQFASKTNNSIIERTYKIDINNMTGSPQNFISPVTQKAIQDIDGESFITVSHIELFVAGFSEQHSGSVMPADYDLFCSNIALYSLNRISDADLSGQHLSLTTPLGTYFLENDNTNYKTLIASLRVKNNLVAASRVRFYQFIEDKSINQTSSWYLPYGGYGWRCLNQYNIVGSTDSENAIEQVPASNEFHIQKSICNSKATNFKCVAVYEGIAAAAYITITNQTAEQEVVLESDSGTEFSFDQGTPILTCKYLHNGAEVSFPSGTQFYWGTEDQNGIYSDIQNNTASYQVIVATISNYATYYCSAVHNETLLGTAEIRLINKYEAAVDVQTQSAQIINGSRMQLYDELGFSPADDRNLKPVVIKPLEPQLITAEGELIEGAALNGRVRWQVPAQDSMIEPIGNQTVQGDYKVFTTTNLSYTIANRYRAKSLNNTIKLEITWENSVAVAYSNLSFMKQGMNGTNGSKQMARIVPNTANKPYLPIICNGTPNWQPASQNWFKVELTDGSDQVYQEGNDFSVDWDIPDSDEYGSWYSVTQSGRVTYQGQSGAEPVNLLRATITVTSDGGMILQAFMPLITVTDNNFNNNYRLNCGFLEITFQNDGTNPIQDDDAFQITNINDDKIDVSWGVIGREFTQLQQSDVDPDKWQVYGQYDGKDRTTAVVGSYDNEQYSIHIPIYCHLNVYGNAALNGWDGNTIDLNTEEGVILAPQVGAGIKETDNTFTGLVMGTQRNTSEEQAVGLFGFNHGVRTLFLSADDGSAVFGASDNQIVIDPDGDLSISFSNGNFSVDQNGHLTCRGADILDSSGNDRFSVYDDLIEAKVSKIGDFTASGFKWSLTADHFQLSSIKNGVTSPVFTCDEDGIIIGGQGQIQSDNYNYPGLLDDYGDAFSISGTKIDLHNGMIISPNFTIDADGITRLKAGKIGEYDIVTTEGMASIGHAAHAWKLRSAKVTNPSVEGERYYTSLTKYRNLVVSNSETDSHTAENDVTDLCNIGYKSQPWNNGQFKHLQVDGQVPIPQTFAITLAADAWTQSPVNSNLYYQEVTVPNLINYHSSKHTIELYISDFIPTDGQEDVIVDLNVMPFAKNHPATSASNNIVVFYSKGLPSADLQGQLAITETIDGMSVEAPILSAHQDMSAQKLYVSWESAEMVGRFVIWEYDTLYVYMTDGADDDPAERQLIYTQDYTTKDMYAEEELEIDTSTWEYGEYVVFVESKYSDS